MRNTVFAIIVATANLAFGQAVRAPQPPEPPAQAAQTPAQPAPPVPPAHWRGGLGSYLGIGVQEVDSQRAKALKLSEELGVEVTMVADDSPAAKAGLKEGDVVLEYNGQKVAGAEQFARLVRETPVGRTVKLLVSRNGATQTIPVTVGNRTPHDVARAMAGMHRQFGDDSKFQRDMQKLQEELGRMRFNVPDLPAGPMAWRNSLLGVETETLSPQLAGFFGVKEGLLVRSVASGTAAEKAGLKAGDVITQVAGNAVSNPQQISRSLRQAAGKPVPVTIMREKKQLTLNVTVEVQPQSSGRWNRRLAPRMPGRVVAFRGPNMV